MSQAIEFHHPSSRLQELLQKRDYQHPLAPLPRFTGISIILFLIFIIIALRLSWVMVGLPKSALPGPQKNISHILERADIVDRNGEVLATNLITFSLYAQPKEVMDPEEAAQKLGALFPELNSQTLYKSLTSKKTFIWIKRNLTPTEQEAVNYLGLVGIHFKKEQKRIYPHKNLLSHVIGYTDIDNKGLAGIERKFEEKLHVKKEPIRLSLDLRVQYILRDAILKGMKEFHSKAGRGIVMDVNNGEIVAMVSLPDFNPHAPSPTPTLFNANTLGIYEMGSIFKIFTFAMALDSHKVSLNEGFDASHPFLLGKFPVKDYQGKNRWLSVPEVFMYSSNIGTVKMALRVGAKAQKEFFQKIGFLEPLKFELRETGVPMAPREWKDINLATISYGYGLAVSPLHLVKGIASMVNGGLLCNPTLLVDGNKNKPEKRIISSNTSEKLRRLMHLVVKQGSGKKVEAPGYLVGGKTGTANKKVEGGKGYVAKGKHRAGFVAAFPMTEPKYIIFVQLEEPEGNAKTQGFSTGGWTAAPIIKEVIEKAAPILGVIPIDETSPKVEAAMKINLPRNGEARVT